MSPQLEQILQAIRQSRRCANDQLSPAEQAQILQRLTMQTENPARKVSRLVGVSLSNGDRFSEFLQTEGYYEDDYIQQSVADLEI